MSIVIFVATVFVLVVAAGSSVAFVRPAPVLARLALFLVDVAAAAAPRANPDQRLLLPAIAATNGLAEPSPPALPWRLEIDEVGDARHGSLRCAPVPLPTVYQLDRAQFTSERKTSR